MRYFNRLIISLALFWAGNAHAVGFFLEGLEWRATETNDWVYNNSETVPNQTIAYKTLDFNYKPGFRIGAFYVNNWDALFAYTHYYTSTSDSAVGHLQPSFSGSVSAKPSAAYLYSSGQVNQTINYNIFDLDVGKQFHPTEAITLHPLVGLMGGWINQLIKAQYQGSTSTHETITNNFTGIGPKVGIDVDVNFFFVSFATSYLLGHWTVSDYTTVIPTRSYTIQGASRNLGAVTLQGAIGLKSEYKQWAFKLAYEMSDWFDQVQYFDNDTGAHNNDLVLQGLTLGISYNFT